MAPGKRPYVPKTRGCHECSQRRIHCDGTRPNCVKCGVKGLKCSGYGIRYRFSDEVHSKGRTGGRRESRPYQPNKTPDTEDSRYGKNEITVQPLIFDESFEDGLINYNSIEQWTATFCLRESPDIDTLWPPYVDTFEPEEDLFYLDDSSSSEIMNYAPEVSLILPTSLEPWKEYFLTYFSSKIAPEMVAIDDRYNGWRSLILPISQQDELVRDAVLSASAFHFATAHGDHLFKPGVIYQKAISSLRKRQNLEIFDTDGQQNVLLALLVFLAAFMVNGYSDFRIIFKLLDSALDAIGGEDALSGELGVFLQRQIRKYRNYASPFLNRDVGTATLSLTKDTIRPSKSNGWACFRSFYASHPYLSESLTLLYYINESTCDIYTTRALQGSDAPPLTDMVQRTIDLMETVPPGAPGEHILVWPCFIAAMESHTPEHRQYFADALCRHYKRNGFANIAKALEHLDKVWANETDRDWTKNVAELPVFIV